MFYKKQGCSRCHHELIIATGNEVPPDDEESYDFTCPDCGETGLVARGIGTTDAPRHGQQTTVARLIPRPIHRVYFHKASGNEGWTIRHRDFPADAIPINEADVAELGHKPEIGKTPRPQLLQLFLQREFTNNAGYRAVLERWGIPVQN